MAPVETTATDTADPGTWERVKIADLRPGDQTPFGKVKQARGGFTVRLVLEDGLERERLGTDAIFRRRVQPCAVPGAADLARSITT